MSSEPLTPPVAKSSKGLLLLVVGPSGAGKDTLIDIARDSFSDCPRVGFARRTVTRTATAHEDHDTLSPAAFEAAVASGAFALDWSAHGLRYGIPVSVLDNVQAGRIMVCNGSRTTIERARALGVPAAVVLITAPPNVLAARIAGRGRDSDAADRLARKPDGAAALVADLVIDNSGSKDIGGSALVAFIARALADDSTGS